MTFSRFIILLFFLGSISACGTFTNVNPPEPGELGPDPGAGTPE